MAKKQMSYKEMADYVKKLRLPYDSLGCGVLADRAAGCRHRKGLGDHPAHVH